MKFIPLLLIVFISCAKEEPIVPNKNENNFGIDLENKVIVYNGNLIEIYNGRLLLGDLVFEVGTNKKFSIGEAYTVKLNGVDFKMFLTELPIVSITTDNIEIVDEPKVEAEMKIFENNKTAFTSTIGIEIRGGFSQTFPKKSYDIELTEKASLLEMRNDDDWILDGMWNEPNRLREFTSFDLWLDIARVQNPNYDTKMGIDRAYCELFLNGIYRGLYFLGEKIDRKQLDLEEYDNQLEGELYKGYTWADGVSFTGVEEFDNSLTTWSGYEAKYPDNIGEINWSFLQEHVNFVVTSSQFSFNNSIASRIDVDNAVDYFIFVNLIYAADNTGKNIYTCKLNSSSPYFFVAWDLDGSFGNNWRGERKDITDHILSNGLFNKLLNFSNFRTQLKARWLELRTKLLKPKNIKALFRKNYEYLERNKVYQREALVPELEQNYSDTELEYIASWIDRRIDYLDSYFDSL